MGSEDRHASLDSSLGEFIIRKYVVETGSDQGSSDDHGIGFYEVNVEKVYITEIGIAAVVLSGTSDVWNFYLRERQSTAHNDPNDNGTTGWTVITPSGVTFPTDLSSAGLYIYRPRGGIATLRPYFKDSSNRAVIQANFLADLTCAAADANVTGCFWMKYKPVHVVQ